MVVGPRPKCVRRLALVAALACLPVSAQTTLKLKDVNTRNATDFAPLYLQQKLTVTGVINAPPFHFPAYSLLSMEDEGYGAVLRVTDARLDAFHPGDEIRVNGTIQAFSGMAIIVPDKIERIGSKPLPAPQDLSVADLQSNRYLGRLVHTELPAAAAGETSNGAYLDIEASGLYRIFVPRAPGQTPHITGFAKGDVVQVTGIAYQYCQVAPFNRYYQLLVNSPETLARKDRGLPPLALAGALGVVLLVAFFLWGRERRLRNQRETLRRTYELGEQILGASSAQSILGTIAKSLPAILGVSRVHLYTYNRSAKSLDEVS
jgi:hypothetical protein